MWNYKGFALESEFLLFWESCRFTYIWAKMVTPVVRGCGKLRVAGAIKGKLTPGGNLGNDY